MVNKQLKEVIGKQASVNKIREVKIKDKLVQDFIATVDNIFRPWANETTESISNTAYIGNKSPQSIWLL